MQDEGEVCHSEGGRAQKGPEPVVESEALGLWDGSISLSYRGFVETGSPRAGKLSVATACSEHPQSPRFETQQ